MIAFLAGAGFSKWAAGLPLARELFDFKINPFGVREANFLERVKHLKDTWDRHHHNGAAEEFIADAVQSSLEEKMLVLWYVVRRLSEAYIWEDPYIRRTRRHVLMIDERRLDDRPGVIETRTFLVSALGPLLGGIITTNYDLLFEYALGSKAFNYGQPGEQLYGSGPYPVSTWIRPILLTGHIPIAKVHGSISWDRQGRYTDGRRALSGEALIIPPIPHKSAMSELQNQWLLSKRILNRTSSLIVFGFAFNPYDKEFLSHLRENGDNIKNVLLVNRSENMQRAQEIWPTARIEFTLPPPSGDELIRMWVKANTVAR